MTASLSAPAPLGARVGAYVLDGVFWLLLCVGLFGVVFLTAEGGDPSVGALVGVLALLLAYAVLLLWLLATRGTSPGKSLMHLRVVQVQHGRPLGWGRALGRTLLLGVITGWTSLLGAAVLFVLTRKDPQRRSLHDKAVGSIVVTARSVPQPAAAAAAPLQPAAVPPPSVVGAQGPWDDATVMPQQSAPVGGRLISAVPGVPQLGAEVLDDDELTADPTAAYEDEGVELTRMAAPRATQLGWQLEVGAGQVVWVGGAGLLGRDPEPRRGEAVEHLVAVDDPTRSVSKTHLEFGVDGDSLWVCDRGSTNGSRVVTADGEEHVCRPGERVQVTGGSTLWVGEHRVRVRRA